MSYSLRTHGSLVTTKIYKEYVQISKRLISTSTGTKDSPPAEITKWINKLQTRPPRVSTDTIHPQRALQLARTLPTRQRIGALGLPKLELEQGDPIPKGLHLAWFQPDGFLGDLAEDGSSTEYNAPAPYLRRMWAGGSFTWKKSSRQIEIGDEITEKITVAKAEFKSGMIFVHQQRDLFAGVEKGDSDYAVREIRTHVFRQDVKAQNEAVKKRALESKIAEPDPPATYTYTYTPSSPLLFRYSALTFNAHRIHYDKSWTQQIEGHPDLVVHGPLTATLLIELAEKISLDENLELEKFEYRATNPMYVDREIRLSAWKREIPEIEGEGEGEGEKRREVWELRAEQDGRIGMRASSIVGNGFGNEEKEVSWLKKIKMEQER